MTEAEVVANGWCPKPDCQCDAALHVKPNLPVGTEADFAPIPCAICQHPCDPIGAHKQWSRLVDGKRVLVHVGCLAEDPLWRPEGKETRLLAQDTEAPE